jgi:hypothetical protein
MKRLLNGLLIATMSFVVAYSDPRAIAVRGRRIHRTY